MRRRLQNVASQLQTSAAAFPFILYIMEARPLGDFSLILGCAPAVLLCDVFGAPYRLQHKQGAYKMIGRRGGNLRVFWGNVRGLCADGDLAHGIPQGQ